MPPVTAAYGKFGHGVYLIFRGNISSTHP